MREPATGGSTGDERALRLAQEIGRNWSKTNYDRAESHMHSSWNGTIWPLIADCDFSVVVDLAAGHGRNTEKLLEFASKLYVVDINAENIEFCRRRFGGDPRLEYIVCDGVSLAGIPDDQVSLVYSFDSMVHFDTDTIRAYLREFKRVLRTDGRAMCHHSNYTGNPTGDFQSPHWRNFMSRELFAHYANKEGLAVVRAELIDWELPTLDCITVLEQPAHDVSYVERSQPLERRAHTG